MEIEPLGTELIERYLQSRRLRFFRSDDGEEFMVLSTYEWGKLHVNQRINGLRRDVLEISISPAGYEYGADLFEKIERAVCLPSAHALEQWMDRTG